MCKPASPPSSSASRRGPLRKKHSLLLTTESFGSTHDEAAQAKKNDDGSDRNGHPTVDQEHLSPSVLSTILTIGVVILMLAGIEHGLRYVFDMYKDVHPLFLVEHNRQILARHIGVDTVACLAVAIVGVRNSHILNDLTEHYTSGTLGRGSSDSTSMREDHYGQRMFTYHPASQQVLLLFFAYQVKNTYDSWVWNDGIIFLLHHLLSGVTAWGAMYPGAAHFYALFFMGISEVSTAILCLLANFDDEFGVVGLGDAFPTTKIALGGAFAVAFVVCRTILWPICTYHFLRDSKKALQCESSMAVSRKNWIKLFMYCSVALSFLQVIFLGQIIWTIKEEVGEMMSVLE